MISKRKHVWVRTMIIALSLILMGVLFTACSGGEQKASSGSPEEGGKETIDLRIGSGYTADGVPWTRVVKEYFVPEVSKALEGTNYQIEWTEAYGGTIATPGEELEAVQTGLLDLAFVVSPMEPSELVISNLGYNVPFSSSDPAVLQKAMYTIYDKYPEFAGEYEKANQKVLALGMTESYDLISNFPIEKMSDLKGEKIGAIGSNLKWIEPTGVVPVQSNLPQVYQQLQTGVFDGYIIYSGSTYGYKLHEQAKYYTEAGLGSAIIGALTINQDVWAKLPEEVQKAMEEVATNYPDVLAQEISRERSESLEKIESEGAIISQLSDEERANWTEMVSNIPNAYAQRMNEAGLPGTEIVRDYIQAQIDAGYQFPAPYQID